MTAIRPVEGASMTMDEQEALDDWQAARAERGLKIGEKAVYFISDMLSEWNYAMRDEIIGGSWKNSPRVCGA